MTKAIKLKDFDAAEYLNSAEECALYLKEFAGDENQVLLISAISDVIHSSGLEDQARSRKNRLKPFEPTEQQPT